MFVYYSCIGRLTTSFDKSSDEIVKSGRASGFSISGFEPRLGQTKELFVKLVSAARLPRPRQALDISGQHEEEKLAMLTR